MLNHLKKFFNPEEETVEMTTETTQVAQGENAEMATLVAELSEIKASFAAVSEELTAAKEQLNVAQASLKAIAEEKVKAEADAYAAKMTARRKSVEASMGTEKADAFMTATKDMDDATFESLSGIFTTNATAEAAGEMFNEVGAEGQTNAEDAPKVMHFNKFIPKKKETK